MKRDALQALESFYAGQDARPRMDKLEEALRLECQEVDFVPVVSGLRKVLPVAAALFFGVLAPGAGQGDVDRLADEVHKTQFENASSVPTELETPWQN
jgi:hypothetical protein